jgi:hypothetical protein
MYRLTVNSEAQKMRREIIPLQWMGVHSCTVDSILLYGIFG